MNISDIADNENELGNIYRDGREYIIEIECWNNKKVVFRTKGAVYILHRVELIDEIGSVIIDGNLYKFMTPDDEETILEIYAEQIVQIN